MFVSFFFQLRERGIPVTPTAFLRLQKAFSMGLVTGLGDFYTCARAILVKSERYFDVYDQVFAHHFRGEELEEPGEEELLEAARALLEEWLKHPRELAEALGLDENELRKMTPEEVVQYFMDRLREQTEAHHGGNKWIGTGGTSPVGHSGRHPGGMRIGGSSRNRSAVKVAMERRYRDYSQDGPLTAAQMGEALKRLRRMVPEGPKDVLNVEKTVYETVRNAGEIEIVHDRRLKDRLKVALLIDNGGWSMDPYIPVVQTLFHYARSQFRDLKIYFFHNTVYEEVWLDVQRWKKPVSLLEFTRQDPETRVIFVGDASMGSYELIDPAGRIYLTGKKTKPSIESLRLIASTFRHSVWMNPRFEEEWRYTWSIGVIRKVFPMFELTLDGLEKAVRALLAKN